MKYQVSIEPVADLHIRQLRAADRQTLLAAFAAQLENQPDLPTRAIKRLRPNPVAAFELRVGDLRALYDVVADRVVIRVIGVKAGNQLIVQGEVFDGL